MYIDCRDFYETENAFLSKSINLENIDLSKAQLVVKAHEKEICSLPNDLILAKVHRDNDGVYPFSKVDFLSHKLQELVFPRLVPKIHFGLFEDEDKPMFILEKVKLDKLHIAYNIKRQIHHKASGRSFNFDPEFLRLEEKDDLDKLAMEHFDRVNEMQKQYAGLIDKYGLAFDHSHVNITWREDGGPVSVEVHKCRRDYLFNLDRCKKYFESLHEDKDTSEEGLVILGRIEELLAK